MYFSSRLRTFISTSCNSSCCYTRTREKVEWASLACRLLLWMQRDSFGMRHLRTWWLLCASVCEYSAVCFFSRWSQSSSLITLTSTGGVVAYESPLTFIPCYPIAEHFLSSLTLRHSFYLLCRYCMSVFFFLSFRWGCTLCLWGLSRNGVMT